MKTMTRSQFFAMDAAGRMQHVRSGGVLVDDDAAGPVYVKAGQISRTAFDAMDPTSRIKVVKAGTQIVDSIDAPAGPREMPFPPVPPQPGHKWQRSSNGMFFVQVPDDAEPGA